MARPQRFAAEMACRGGKRRETEVRCALFMWNSFCEATRRRRAALARYRQGPDGKWETNAKKARNSSPKAFQVAL